MFFNPFNMAAIWSHGNWFGCSFSCNLTGKHLILGISFKDRERSKLDNSSSFKNWIIFWKKVRRTFDEFSKELLLKIFYFHVDDGDFPQMFFHTFVFIKSDKMRYHNDNVQFVVPYVENAWKNEHAQLKGKLTTRKFIWLGVKYWDWINLNVTFCWCWNCW